MCALQGYELYDLVADPHETNNIFNEAPRVSSGGQDDSKHGEGEGVGVGVRACMVSVHVARAGG